MSPDIIWASVVGAFLAVFGVFEGLALHNDTAGDTLSETLRRWLGIVPHKPWRTAGVAVFVAFLVWFGLHITAGLA
ncbi:MAG: hypothetical protein ACRDMV_13270 [Streptosporangiales bacterium]